MGTQHRRKIAPIALVLGGLLVAGCTRSASTPVVGNGGQTTPNTLTGQQATMEAVRAALLTQTAQSLAQATAATQTAVPTIALATATPGQGVIPPVATAIPTTIGSTGGAGCPSSYIVQPGDRLFRIAIDLGYDPGFWENIAAANNLSDPWLIYPGDELTIPCI